MGFDFERMDVYKLSLIMVDQVVLIGERIPRGHRYLADQILRSSASVVLNLCEGAGEFKPKEKARFYRMALRSASETCSIVEIVFRMKMISSEERTQCYGKLLRISKMMTKLITSMERRT